MTINELWKTIPEDLHNDIYEYVGEAMEIKSKAFGPAPLIPISLNRLNNEQLELVNFIRQCAYLEKVVGIPIRIRSNC